jgi:hypothetical protein
LIDITDEEARDNLARASVMALSFVAQSAREAGQPPVPQSEIDEGRTIPERFLIRWRGEANPDHVKAIDAYWISAAEHGMNASTFTGTPPRSPLGSSPPQAPTSLRRSPRRWARCQGPLCTGAHRRAC